MEPKAFSPTPAAFSSFAGSDERLMEILSLLGSEHVVVLTMPSASALRSRISTERAHALHQLHVESTQAIGS